MKSNILLLLLASGMIIGAAELAVPPDFANRMKSDYGGNNLREAFIHAGVPLEKSDRIEFNSNQIKLSYSTSKVATEMINSLVAEVTAGRPSVRDAGVVRAALVGKVCRFDGAKLNGVKLPGGLRFSQDGAASEVDPPIWREAKQYRWGVSKSGVMELRNLRGQLLLTGRLSAVGELMVAGPSKVKEFTVRFESKDTARR